MMARIKFENKTIGIPDGSEIKETCEDLGVPFNCKNGTCGTCIIEVTHGKDNLSPLNEKEKMLGLDETHRLACQCRIKSGDIDIDF